MLVSFCTNVYMCLYVNLCSGVLPTFIDILTHPVSNVSHMLQRGNRSNSCMDSVVVVVGGGLQQNVFHNIIPPVLGCICMPRLGTATRIGFSPQYRQKAALETQKDVWLSKVLLQWCRIIHALILILKYILYIFALFLYSLGGFFLCKRVSLLTVLAYKTVFLKRLLG